MAAHLNDCISIIIPAFNEEKHITATLKAASACRGAEITVVDAGSTDTTVERARAMGVRVLVTRPGKGHQMNLGAGRTTGRFLLFLHADTILPANYGHLVKEALLQPSTAAGAFSLRIAGQKTGFRLIETGANLRSKLFRLPYGDQAIFTTREMFFTAGGFPDTPIMEDYLFIRNLGKRGTIITLPQHVLTSSRRWENMGMIRTTCINQLILLGHALGLAPETLARLYQRARGLVKKDDA